MDGERIEFVDRAGTSAASDDEVAVGEPPRPPRPGRRGWGWAAVAGVAVLAVVAVAVRAAGAPGGAASPVADHPSTGPSSPSSAVGVLGPVALPRGVGRPWQLATAPTGDVVWLIDRGATVVRVEAGRVTAEQLLEAQATTIAVAPDGGTVYVGLAGQAPGVQVLDARTLRPGRALRTPWDVQALTVSADAVWVVGGGVVRHLGLSDLVDLGTIPLPGVLTVDHLRVGFRFETGAEQLTALATTDAAGGRLLAIDVPTGSVRLGPALPGIVSVATSPLLTWISWTPPGSSLNRTEGFASAFDTTPAAGTATVVAGGRIYDAGGGSDAVYVVAGTSHVVSCRDAGGVPNGAVDLGRLVADAVVTGQVLRTAAALYVVTDHGLVRSGVGTCG